MAEIARCWLAEHVAVHCRPKTESTYRLMVEKHVLPALAVVREAGPGADSCRPGAARPSFPGE